MTTAGVVDIEEVARATARPWEPRDLVQANDTVIRLAKLDGEFAWHKHDEDEVFLCWDGSFRIEIEGQPAVEINAGQLYVVPRGSRHRPVAERTAIALLIERPETLQYGNPSR